MIFCKNSANWGLSHDLPENEARKDGEAIGGRFRVAVPGRTVPQWQCREEPSPSGPVLLVLPRAVW